MIYMIGYTLNERLTQAIESGIYAPVEATTGVQTLFNELIYLSHIPTIANGYLRDLNYKYVNNSWQKDYMMMGSL